MKIIVSLIPESGRKVSFLPENAWVREILSGALAGQQPEIATVKGSVLITRLEANINITGEIGLGIHPPCDRCLETFAHDFGVPLEMNLSPLYGSVKERNDSRGFKDEIELAREDVGFAFYDGTEIDLKEIVREQIVLALPIRFVCRPSCRGLCAGCGTNLNHKQCDCGM